MNHRATAPGAFARVLTVVLAMAALAGWGAYAYGMRAASANARVLEDRVTRLQTERDQATSELGQQRAAAGDLAQVQASLATARADLASVARTQQQTRADLAAAQSELAQVTQRLEQAKDQVSETGAVPQASVPEPAKRRPARTGRRARGTR